MAAATGFRLNRGHGVAAADVKITDDDLAGLDEAVPREAVVGDRYGDMSTIDA